VKIKHVKNNTAVSPATIGKCYEAKHVNIVNIIDSLYFFRILDILPLHSVVLILQPFTGI